jgi:hypothetical protein
MLIISVETYEELEHYLRTEKHKFYNALVTEIETSWLNDEKISKIARAKLNNGVRIIIDIPRNDWTNTLTKCIIYYETIEDYETCIKLQKLIKDIDASKLGDI